MGDSFKIIGIALGACILSIVGVFIGAFVGAVCGPLKLLDVGLGRSKKGSRYSSRTKDRI